MAAKLLLEPEAMDLLSAYEIPRPEYQRATTASEAISVAEGLAYPVVMKIVSPDVLHKTDVGGVRLGLRNAVEVEAAYRSIMQEVAREQPDAELRGVILYPQAPDGLEIIVGQMYDPQFGAVLMFGLGGVFAEALQDISFRVIPIKEADARQMISEIRGHRVLRGWREQPAADIESIVEVLRKVSRLSVEHPEIEEMDLNPVRVYADGVLVLDARIMTRD
jgi:acetyl-CoA synthetase (ADP-forming)